MNHEQFMYEILDLVASDEITATEVKEFLKHPFQQGRILPYVLADLKKVATQDDVFLSAGVITQSTPYTNKIAEMMATIKPRQGLQFFNPEDLQGLCSCAQPVFVYVGNNWTCETCFKGKLPTQDPFFKKRCECGAQKTINPTCHSHWCPKYRR